MKNALGTRQIFYKRPYFIITTLISVLLALLLIFWFVRGALFEAWPADNQWILLTQNGKVVVDHEEVGNCSDPTFGSASPSGENDIGSQAKCTVTRYNPGLQNLQTGAGYAPVGTFQPRTTTGVATPAETYSGAIYFKDVNNDSAVCNNLSDDHLFFRVRLADNPLSSDGNDLKNNSWFATFDLDGDTDPDFYVRLLGGAGTAGSEDVLSVIYEQTGNSVIDSTDYIVSAYTNPLGISPASDTLVRAVPTPNNGILGSSTEYFLDFQVPFTDFKNSGGTQLLCEGTGVSVVNYSTSDNANDVFKKDHMTDGPTDPVVFSNPNYTLEKTATDLNGGTLQTGDVVEYTLKVTNQASGMTGLAVSDPLPLGSSFVPNAYGVGSGVRVSFSTTSGSTYNLSNTSDSPDAGAPACGGAADTRCGVAANFSAGASPSGTVTVTNPFIFAAGSSNANLYDEITIKYQVTYAAEGDYDNQAAAATVQLPTANLSQCTTDGGANSCLASGATRVTVQEVNYDFGDAPDPTYPTLLANNGARHLVGSTLYLGATVDAEADGQPHPLAQGDDGTAGPGDEDGVTFASSTLAAGSTTPITVVSSDTGLLNAWVDFNADGDWADAGEQIATDVSVNAGTNTVSLTIPQNATLGTTFARFRLSTDTGLSYSGEASNGEVEDYAIEINQQADLAVTKTDGQNSAVPGTPITYTIVATNNGPSNVSGATISDTFPLELENVSWTCSSSLGSTCSGSGLGVVLNESVDIQSGGTVTYTVSGTISASATGAAGPLSNTVNLSAPAGVTDPNRANNTATDTTDLTPETDLAITKSGPDTVVAGNNVTYTLSVANNGPSNATGVTVSDTLPVGVTFVSATASQGSGCNNATGVVTCDLGSLASGGLANVMIEVSVAAATANGTNLTNTSSVTGNETDPNPDNNSGQSATKVTQVTTQADLSITKSDAADPVVAGSNLTYNLTVNNAGASNATNVTVTDMLPANSTFVSATPAGDCSEATGIVTCNAGTIPAGGSYNATITIIPLTDGQTTGNTTISNTATVSSANTIDPNLNNNSDTEETQVTPLADLTINKTDSPDPVVAGTNLTYTIAVTNNGPTAAEDVTVEDQLDSNLTFVSATPSQGSCSGSGNISCDFGTVTAGQIVMVTIVAKVNENTPDQTQIENTAEVSSQTPDSAVTNNTSSTTTTVSAQADLTITKSDDPDPVIAGEQITYNITATNNGPSKAIAVQVRDLLPPEVTLVSASATTGTCVESIPGIVECNVGDLNVGDSVDVEIVALVLSSVSNGSVINNTARVSSQTTELILTNNEANESTNVNAVADLSILKEGPDQVVAGNNMIYTLTVQNQGPSDATGIVVSDLLPDGVTFVSATPAGDCFHNAGLVTCNGGNLAAGGIYNVMIEVAVPSGAQDGDQLTNTARVLGNENDPDLSNNEGEDATIITSVTTSADLSIEKTDSQDPTQAGDNLTYSLNVLNNGVSDATNVTVTDILPANSTFVSATPAGDCSEAAGIVTCDAGTIAAGGVYVVNITIKPLTDGQTVGNVEISNTASVNSEDTADPNPNNNTDTETTTVTPLADLSIEKLDNPDPVVAGEDLTYSLSVTNNGPTAVGNVVMTDTLNTYLTFVNAIPSQGVCIEVANNVICSLGTLDAGETVNVTLISTVSSSAPDQFNLANTAEVTTSDQVTPDPIITNNTSSAETTVIRKADLEITKDGSPNVVAGNNLVYSLSVINNGPSDATGVVVSDTLPAGVTYVSATPSQGNCVQAAGTVTCNIGNIAAGDAESVMVEIQVPATMTEGSMLTNTSSVSGDEDDPNLGNNEGEAATVVTDVTTQADLSVQKSDSPDPVAAGEELTYTINVNNEGPSDALDVQLSDQLPSDFVVTSITTTQGLCANNLAGFITCQLGTIPASSNSVEITVTGMPLTNGQETGTVQINNTVSVSSGGTEDPNPENNSAEASTQVTPVADLSIVKSDSPDPVIAGQNLTFGLTVTNNGPSAVADVTVADTLASLFTFVDATTDQGTCGESNGVVTCDLGTLNRDQVVNIVIVVNVSAQAPDQAVLVNESSVETSSSTPDPVITNNTSSTETTVIVPADLSITKIDLQDPVAAGNNITYQLEVTNQGPTEAENVIVTDTLPLGTTFVSATPAGDCSEAAGIVTCNVGTMTVGETAGFTIVVGTQLSTPDQTIVVNTATVSCGEGEQGDDDDDQQESCSDPNDQNNTAVQTTRIFSNTSPNTPGGGGTPPRTGGGSTPTPTPEPEPESEPEISEATMIRESCLSFNPDRDRTFTDLEGLPSHWRRGIETLKFTQLVGTGEYVIDGVGLGPNDQTVSEARVNPLNFMNRFEMFKVIMNAHCLEIKDRTGTQARVDGSPFYFFKDAQEDPDFQRVFPGENFLPNHTDNELLNYYRDIAYSGFYWTVFDGTREKNAELFRPVTIAELVKIMTRVRHLVEGKEPIQEDPGAEFWHPFYEAAANLGISKEFLDNERARESARRAEAFSEIAQSVANTSDLYLPEVEDMVKEFLRSGALN